MSDTAASPARRRPPPRPIEVVSTQRVARSVQRITFGGPQLSEFTPGAPTGHIKIFLPGPGETEPALPTFGPDGPVFPEGRTPPIVRTYTPRRFDAGRGELEVDFFLHGTGPASQWAAAAKVGDRAGVAGPGRGYEPDPTAAWFVLAGDDTAIPALAMLIEALPPDAATIVLAEVESPADEFGLPERAGVEVRWVHRSGRTGGAALARAINELAFPLGDGRVWVATEAAAVRRIRSHLLTDRGLSPTAVVTRGYWQIGAANHPDHDYGE